MTATKAVAAPTDDTIDAAAVHTMTDTKLGATLRAARDKVETTRTTAEAKLADLHTLKAERAQAEADAYESYIAAATEHTTAADELRNLIHALGA